MERHVLAFKDSTDEQYTPVYQIISKDNIESAGLTEYELLLLKAFNGLHYMCEYVADSISPLPP